MDASESAVEIRRRLDAAPEMVFAAFADSSLVSRWLNPAPEVRLDVLIFEFRVGGAYRFATNSILLSRPPDAFKPAPPAKGP